MIAPHNIKGDIVFLSISLNGDVANTVGTTCKHRGVKNLTKRTP
tara:strand:+ start:174 stop:305 length:132 start_codon:yes stop_codon:yes gene_type:complete